MAALLSGDIPGRNFKRKDSLVEHLEDCSRMGIEVAPPCVNQSDVDFTVNDKTIYFGLSAIKSCGGSAAEAIVAERKKGGPYKDLFDFCERVEPSACGRGAIETLIKAGAFDCFGCHRRQLMEGVDRAMQSGLAALADRRSGQKSLFGDDDDDQQSAQDTLPNVPQYDEREELALEKEVLGFYLRSHPLASFKDQLSRVCTHSTIQLSGLKHRSEVIVGGMISAIKLAHTKNSKPGSPTRYANFDIEDMDGAVRCIMWPDDYASSGDLVEADAVRVLQAVVDKSRGDEANLIVNQIMTLDGLQESLTRGVLVRVNQEKHPHDVLKKIKEILRGYPGSGEVQLLLDLEDGNRVQLATTQVRVAVTSELRRRLDDLLGPQGHELLLSKPG